MQNNCFSVGIIGAGGYTGIELIRLIHQHPNFDVTAIVGVTDVDKELGNLYPSLNSKNLPKIKSLEAAGEELNSCDLVFSCLPHGSAYEILTNSKYKKIIDLSSDFRLKSSNSDSWIYGLTETQKQQIKGAKRIANPGCFATAANLLLAPLVESNLISDVINLEGCSGSSGGGKKLQDRFHFSFLDENVYAYKIGDHQHILEIEEHLNLISNRAYKVLLTTRLVPMSRGIHLSSIAKINDLKVNALNSDLLQEICGKYYKNSYFVKVVDFSPNTKSVRGSNFVHLHYKLCERTQQIIGIAVIDNLVKGASGQALQNANLLFGLPESLGLENLALFP
jgi:N-acetyl-gamma-glutamyl-phosphate reductase